MSHRVSRGARIQPRLRKARGALNSAMKAQEDGRGSPRPQKSAEPAGECSLWGLKGQGTDEEQRQMMNTGKRLSGRRYKTSRSLPCPCPARASHTNRTKCSRPSTYPPTQAESPASSNPHHSSHHPIPIHPFPPNSRISPSNTPPNPPSSSPPLNSTPHNTHSNPRSTHTPPRTRNNSTASPDTP